MILGIKYCGGCNPAYDRVACVTDLKRYLSDLEILESVSFVPYDEKIQFDYCLLVRGCNRSCVSDRKFSNCRHFYAASGREDFIEIKTKMYAQMQIDLHAE